MIIDIIIHEYTGNTYIGLRHWVKMVPKRKNNRRWPKRIGSEGDQETYVYQILGHYFHAFFKKIPETHNLKIGQNIAKTRKINRCWSKWISS